MFLRVSVHLMGTRGPSGFSLVRGSSDAEKSSVMGRPPILAWGRSVSSTVWVVCTSATTTPGLGLLSGKANLTPLLEPGAAPFEKAWELCVEEGGPPGVPSVPLCPAASRELCTGVCVWWGCLWCLL